MTRPRPTPEESEARRRERSRRSFSDAAYRHYDPAREGYGRADEWIAAAEAMAAGLGRFSRIAGNKSETKRNPAMVVLGLTEMPADIAGLKRAFRNAMFVAHPDHGGTDEAARNVLAAYKTLLHLYEARV